MSKETIKRIIKNIDSAFKELEGSQKDYFRHVEIINSFIYAIAQESDRLEDRIKKLEELNNGK